MSKMKDSENTLVIEKAVDPIPKCVVLMSEEVPLESTKVIILEKKLLDIL